MNEREMLELAAKAAGMIPKEFAGNDAFMDGVLERWNSLQDDGDALRLAVKLQMNVWIGDGGTESEVDTPKLMPSVLEKGNDTYAATSRAITRAAAQIGKSMP